MRRQDVIRGIKKKRIKGDRNRNIKTNWRQWE